MVIPIRNPKTNNIYIHQRTSNAFFPPAPPLLLVVVAAAVAGFTAEGTAAGVAVVPELLVVKSLSLRSKSATS